MNRATFALGLLMSQFIEPRFNTKLQLLIFQIGMLRNRIDALKIVPTPRERTELMRLGELLGHDVSVLMIVVRPDTYKKWVRDHNRGKDWVLAGRRGTPEAIRNLLCRMTEANPRWGHRRIVGELKKLGIRIGATTVRDVLKRMGFFPEPTRGKSKGNLRWRTFIEANKESMLATDFSPRRFGRCGESASCTFLPLFTLEAAGSSVARVPTTRMMNG
jgi:putative transposase